MEDVLPVIGGFMPEIQIRPEAAWRRVWHTNCEKSLGGNNGIMVHRSEIQRSPDGSSEALLECLHCGVQTYGGLDKDGRIVTRTAAIDADQPARHEVSGLWRDGVESN